MSTELLKFPRLQILLLVFTFANFMAILFTPALPELAQYFAIDPSVAARTMSIFLVGYAIGQLPYGALANRYGRKGAFTIGAIIALCGTLLAYFANSFEVLCLARFLQAIGSSAGLKVVFTMIGDLHAGEKAAHAIATLSMAFGLIPAVATAIGGFVTVYAGWRGCFLLLTVYTIVLWFLTRYLPETVKEIDRNALQLSKIGLGLLRQLKDPYVVLHAFLAGLTSSSMYIFVTLSPHIGIKQIGLTPDAFGLWAMIPSIGLLVGTFFSRKYSGKNPRVIMISGILIILLSTSVLSILFANGIVNAWSLFLPMFFMYLGNNLNWSQALSHGLSGARDKSNASAVMQFVNVGTATVSVFLVELFKPTSIMLMPAAFGVLVFFMLIVWLKLKAHHPTKG